MMERKNCDSAFSTLAVSVPLATTASSRRSRNHLGTYIAPEKIAWLRQ
jgi:hypothetical protein